MYYILSQYQKTNSSPNNNKISIYDILDTFCMPKWKIWEYIHCLNSFFSHNFVLFLYLSWFQQQQV